MIIYVHRREFASYNPPHINICGWFLYAELARMTCGVIKIIDLAVNDIYDKCISKSDSAVSYIGFYPETDAN